MHILSQYYGVHVISGVKDMVRQQGFYVIWSGDIRKDVYIQAVIYFYNLERLYLKKCKCLFTCYVSEQYNKSNHIWNCSICLSLNWIQTLGFYSKCLFLKNNEDTNSSSLYITCVQVTHEH